jgi:UDP-N-acetylmuramyl pentapeptide phosphotransferase/UDP-N-acetylglucosamine-1-phosphate transferase
MTAFLLLILFLNLCIFLNYERLSTFINLYDIPDNKRKLHKKKIPNIGGFFIIIKDTGFYFAFINTGRPMSGGLVECQATLKS